MIEYRTLSVRIESLHEDRYKAIVCGPDGDGQAVFELPFDGPVLDALASAVSRPRSARRRIESDESAQAREFGERLFDLVFRDTARDVLRSSLTQARRENHGLRLMFQLEGARQLRNVPWELLCDSSRFISTSAYTPVLRYADIPSRPPPLSVRAPLRILGMVSSPADMPALDAAREREHLEQACSSLTNRGLVKIDWVELATLGGLLKYLNDGDYHIFHFIGHGDFDEQAEDGVLLFEGRGGRSHRVTGVDLGTILEDQHTLRLAVINACEGARVALDSSGIAASLMRYGTPAVIAMQFEISDEAAIGFAEHFYESVARSHPIDEALADARRGMFAAGHGLEWATPVLFTSVDDGRLFEVGWDRSESSEPATKSRESEGDRERTGKTGDKDDRYPTPRVAGAVAAALAAVTIVVLAVAGVFSGGHGLSFEQPISVGETPVGIALAHDRVWVTDTRNKEISSIDPHTGKVDDHIKVEGEPNSIAVDSNGYVWVANIDTHEVAVYDPNRRPPSRPLHSYPVGSKPNAIVLKFGKVWVANSGEDTVSEIDQRSATDEASQEVKTIPKVGMHPSGIAAGEGAVWVASSDSRTVARINPTTEGVNPISIERSVNGVAVEKGMVWVTNPAEGTVTRIVPSSEGGEVLDRRIPVGREPKGIFTGSKGVWVVDNKGGKVVWIAPDSDRIGREIKPGGEPNAVAVGLGAVWVTKLDNSSVTPFMP
jgi:DNA-binding beta-propeller fold protein YncE